MNKEFSGWTADEVRDLLLKIAGGPISVTQRVELFDIASNYAEHLEAATLRQQAERVDEVSPEELYKQLTPYAAPDCRDCDGRGVYYGNVCICGCVMSKLAAIAQNKQADARGHRAGTFATEAEGEAYSQGWDDANKLHAERTGGEGEAVVGVDCLGLALDLEQQIQRCTSQTMQRSMEAAAHGLHRLAGTCPPAQQSGVAVSEEVRDSVAKIIAGRIGNGMREKYYPQADAIIEAIAPLLAGGVPDGPLTGKYGAVLTPFVTMMVNELHANAGKGDRPGWLSMDCKTALLEIFYHLAKLQKAVKNSDAAGVREYSADVANMSMMLADICGVLAARPSQPTDAQDGAL